MSTFDEDLEVSRKGDRYRGAVPERWLVNGNPFGGFLMALIANAMMLDSEREDTPIVTATFISKCDIAEADISVELINRSKQFDRLEARLSQDGKERIRAFGTFKTPHVECPLRRYDAAPPDVPPPEECLQVVLGQGYTLFDQLDVRLDPGAAGSIAEGSSDRSEMKGWVTFREERPYDAPAVILATDCFPPAVLATQGMLAWVPTIEMSVSIRNIPRSKWLKCIFRTRFIDCGLVEEDGEVWDEDGSIVAISRQIAQFRNNPNSQTG